MVHGWRVGGGSEMALSNDIVIMSEDARIGTPYWRMRGCHHAGTWVYRLGVARAKELALTGRLLSGVEAARDSAVKVIVMRGAGRCSAPATTSAAASTSGTTRSSTTASGTRGATSS